jgi:predicted nucleotidyltransferase
MDLPSTAIDAIVEWAESVTPVEQVILIGARAEWGARPNSDVDLALRLREPSGLDAYQLHRATWGATLRKATGLTVNLSALSTNARGVQEKIDDHGVTLFERRC